MFRRLSIALVVAASPLIIIPISAAPANAANFCGTTDWCTDSWWQNSNDTGLAGQLVINCGGSKSQWGIETQYETMSQGSCAP